MQFCCGEMHARVPRIRLSLDNKLLRKRFVCSLLKLLLLTHNYATLFPRITSGEMSTRKQKRILVYHFSVESYSSMAR